MWILPKSLTSRFAPGTEALTSDCGDASRTCAQLLMRRSRPSRASSFSREWKAGNLIRLRSGLISSHSLGESFADWWTSFLAATRASHSPAQARDSEAKTRDTSGRLSQAAFDFFNLESASLRTSRATLPKGCITSCLTWEDWVTEQRGEFSARLNAARLISGSGCLSWPTPTANEDKDQNATWETLAKPDKGGRILRRIATLATGPADPASRSTDGNRRESWPTPSAMDGQRPSETPQQWEARNAAKKATNPNLGQLHRPLTVAVQCATPRANKTEGYSSSEFRPTLHQQVIVQWATPEAKNQVGYQVGADGTKWPRLGSQVSGKLNPRWVEILMGLPVGWTMPTCASPAIIAPTNCDSSATESCPPPQSSPSES